MKKSYEKPEAEIILIETEGICDGSGDGADVGDVEGEP